MSLKSKIIFKVIIGILILTIGIIIGILFSSKTNIEIDPKIRYSELLNWITTIFIGFLIGYIYKNKYENNKIIKSYLLDDLKVIAENIILLKEYFYTLRGTINFTEDQRRDTASRIDNIDKKIKVFNDLLKDCDKEKHKELSETLINGLNRYNKVLTGDSSYSNPIEQSYFTEINLESSKFESVIRSATLNIIKQM